MHSESPRRHFIVFIFTRTLLRVVQAHLLQLRKAGLRQLTKRYTRADSLGPNPADKHTSIDKRADITAPPCSTCAAAPPHPRWFPHPHSSLSLNSPNSALLKRAQAQDTSVEGGERKKQVRSESGHGVEMGVKVGRLKSREWQVGGGQMR